ncbi:MAG: NusG domain II-containing protein [Thermodesulfobacteriota bacterium]|nr:NusG domain II-containing protein [Thermodesulfobacteriota bacterium]
MISHRKKRITRELLNGDDHASDQGLTPWDILLFGVLVIICVVWGIRMMQGEVPASMVEIYNKDGLYAVKNLDANAFVHVPGPLGDSVVVIEASSVYMKSSPCPKKICVHMGVIHKAGSSIICIPNRVCVKIRGTSQDKTMDAITQ